MHHQRVATVLDLPRDLLSAIFDFAPHQARLRVLSTVCKRWRAAALRSISIFTPSERASVKEAVALLPCLRELDLSTCLPECIDSFTLPYLVRLTLTGSFSSVFSTRLPHLTALTLFGQPTYLPFAGFLRVHSTQLVELSLVGCDNLTHLTSLEWPALRKLTMAYPVIPDAYTLIERATALKELALETSTSQFVRLSDCYLTSLTSIDCLHEVTSESVKKLVRLTTLRLLNPKSVMHLKDVLTLPPQLQRTVCALMLTEEPWHCLERSFSQLRVLHYIPVSGFRLPPCSLTLACLSVVDVGVSMYPISARQSLEFATYLLRRQAYLSWLHFTIRAKGEEDAVELIKKLISFVVLSYSVQRLRLQILDTDIRNSVLAPAACALGWMQLYVTY